MEDLKKLYDEKTKIYEKKTGRCGRVKEVTASGKSGTVVMLGRTGATMKLRHSQIMDRFSLTKPELPAKPARSKKSA